MKFTLYGVGQALQLNPAVAKSCMKNGHDIASHAYRWIDFHSMPPDEEKAMIKQAMECQKALTGEWPKGWYYGRLSPRSRALVREVFDEMGAELLWNSDTYADDVPYWVDVPAERSKPDAEKKGMLMVPYSYDCNDFKYHAPSGFSDPTGFYDHVKGAFDTLYEEGGKMMTVGLHCRIAGKPGRYAALKRFVQYVAGKEGVWVTTRTQIAEHFKDQFPYMSGTLAGRNGKA